MDETLVTVSSPGAYLVPPETARRAALYVAGRLGRGCGDILDALGLRTPAVPARVPSSPPTGGVST